MSWRALGQDFADAIDSFQIEPDPRNLAQLEAVVNHGVPDELVEQVAEALFLRGLPHRAGLEWTLLPKTAREHYFDSARAAIEAVYAYQAEHGARSDAMNADWWVEPPRDGEA